MPPGVAYRYGRKPRWPQGLPAVDQWNGVGDVPSPAFPSSALPQFKEVVTNPLTQYSHDVRHRHCLSELGPRV
jgi:hypothetical protein